MKKLLFSIFLLFSLISNAQQVEFKTEAYNISLYNNTDSTYAEWGEWEVTEIKVVLDLDSAIFKIFSQYEQKYKISNMSFFIEEGHKVLEFETLDNFDQAATLRFLYLEDYQSHQLYIIWRQLRMVYQMKRL